MISGAAQADVCLLMVPADGNFTTAIQKGDHKAGEIQGQTRQHARLINLLGVKQLIIGVNKMDSDTAGYKQVSFKTSIVTMSKELSRLSCQAALPARTYAWYTRAVLTSVCCAIRVYRSATLRSPTR